MNPMHRMRRSVPLLLVLPVLLGQQGDPGGNSADKVRAEQPEAVTGTYKVDPVHSSNVFRIKHMDVAYFYGRFNEIEGQFVLDEARPEAASFEVTLDAGSVDTNNAARDKHLRSPDYFDTEKYPDIRFKSKTVRKLDARTLEASGDLTMHGQTRPLTARVELTGAAKGRQGEFRAGWETTFTIKRSDFGMKVEPGLSDDVRITVSVEGVRG